MTTAESRSGVTCLRTLFAAPLLAAALLVAVAGPAAAGGGSETSMVASAEVPGALE